MMRYLIYFMIGCGLSLADPYAGLPLPQRFAVYVAWPAIVARDLVNEASRGHSVGKTEDRR